ncbi:MAG TPA: hypothetical protein VF550_12650 [Polyangia bacterium]
MTGDDEPRFAVQAQKNGLDKALYLQNLTFGQLMEDVVVPYERDDSFFIDGVPVQKKELARIKIVRQSPNFMHNLDELNFYLKRGGSKSFVPAADYPMRLDALMRGSGEDVTNRILNAYKEGILPRIKEYIPKRQELISAALTLFVEASKRWAASGGG